MNRLIFSLKKYHAVYFRVPKVASTSLFMAFTKVDEVVKVENYDSSFFKFTFVRNPFDRLASCYRHVIQRGTPEIMEKTPGLNRHMSFEHFVDKLMSYKVEDMDIHFRPQYTFIPENPDFVGKFENINEDFLKLCEKIGVRAPELTRENTTDKTRYDQYYNKMIINKVITIYKKDFELFGYDETIPN